MRKFLLLMIALLTSVSGAWAGTWNITSTDLTTDGWANMSGSVPAGVTALGSYTPWYRTENISVTQTGIITITFRYTSGQDQLVMLGVDLLDGEDNVVASDYHWGKSGSSQDANNYLVTATSTGSYKLRYIINKDGNLDSSQGTITISKIVYANSYANITQWYKIRMHSNQTHYLKSNGSALSFTGAPDDTNNYLWAFVGNPTDGFQIYNYNYGSTKAIDNSNPCGFTTSGTSNAIKLTGGRSGITTSTSFCISMKNGGNYYNYQNDAIQRWSGNDEGSAFILEEATPVSLVEGSTELAPIYYAWRTAVGNNASYIHTDNSGNPVNPNNHDITVTGPIDAKYAWQFVGDAASGFAIKNKATGTYLGGRTASGDAMSMEASATCYFIPIYNSATNNKWYCKNYNYYIDRSGGAPYAHTSGNNNDYIRLYNVKFSLSNAAAGLVVGSTTISDFSAYYLITTSAALSCETDGYVFTAYDGYTTLTEALENDADGTITLTVAPSVNVTYKMMFNGNQITSTVVEEGIGTTASTPSAWTAPAYCSFTCPATEITAETSEIEVTLNWNGPFAIASDYASAVWHYVSIGGAWTLYNGSALAAADSRKDAIEYGDGALWAFIGNPTSFKMYNKALGSTYKLNVGNNLAMATSDTYAPLTITKVSETTFYLANDGSYYLGYDDTRDEGDKYPYVSPADSRALMTAISEYCGQAIEDVYTWAETQPVNTPFGINSSCLTTIENSFATLMSKMTQSEYEAISIPADITSSLVYVYPATGYYRIKNNATNNYLTYGYASRSDAYTERNDWGLITTSSSTDATSVIKLTGSAGTYKISTQGLNVQSSTNADKAFPASSAEGADWVFTAISPGIVAINNAASFVNDNKNGDLHEGTGGWNDDHHGVINWNRGADNSKWTIEDATTITINLNAVDGKSYATFSAPFDVTIGDGAKVYTVELSGDRAVYTEIANKKVPAGAGVLLISETAATSVTATINTGVAFSALADNDLVGYNIAPTFSYPDEDGDWNLVLGVAGGNIGFYKMGTGDPSPNKAYLPYPHTAGAGVKGFRLISVDELETGIGNVEAKQKIDAIYDLSGRRVEKLGRGLYITKGQKLVR